MECLCDLSEIPKAHEFASEMSTKKVLHISTARSWRGGEQQISYLCEELKKLGWEQHIACIADAPLHRWAVDNEIPVLALKKRTSLDLIFSRKLKSYSKEHQIKLWHAHDAHAHGFAVYAAHFFGAESRLLVSRRVDFPVAKSRSSAFKYNHPSVKGYLCVSDAIAQILKASLKYPEKVHTVHSSINPIRFENIEKGHFRSEFPQIAAKKWIGNTAALTGHKDLFTFLETAALLKNRRTDVHFFIAGQGELEEELKAKAHTLGLDEVLYFLGFRQDVPEILTDLDVFLFTSEMEGLGTSVLDAFASQLPVVATAAGGIPEMVENNVTGLLRPIKDAKALASAVEIVLDQTEIKEQIIQGAQGRLPAEMAKKTAEHYEGLLN